MTVDPTMPAAAGRLPAGALAELAAVLLSTGSAEQAVQHVAELGVRRVSAAYTVGITARRGEDVVLSVGANALGRWLTDLEDEFGLGPARDAMSGARPVEVVDTATESRWGELPGEMRDAGIRSVHATPVVLEHGRGAQVALTVYSDVPHAFDEPESRVDLDHLVPMVRDAVSAALAGTDPTVEAHDLRGVLAGRSVVDLAVGIVMGSRGWPAAAARAHLQRRADAHGSTLLRVAQDVVDRVADPID